MLHGYNQLKLFICKQVSNLFGMFPNALQQQTRHFFSLHSTDVQRPHQDWQYTFTSLSEKHPSSYARLYRLCIHEPSSNWDQRTCACNILFFYESACTLGRNYLICAFFVLGESSNTKLVINRLFLFVVKLWPRVDCLSQNYSLLLKLNAGFRRQTQ